ncbi:hypothetical protein Acor_10400 [Acrocarpospora corrugata]|uniref:Uncharacterized protein n=1 Tax=Acrocarpospora corrugata TaxID=35763 RepID=A0A5M3VQB3_9ACTN|nr:hypothetical protein Acor_10400 [Acrocarpospora corrugata]
MPDTGRAQHVAEARAAGEVTVRRLREGPRGHAATDQLAHGEVVRVALLLLGLGQPAQVLEREPFVVEAAGGVPRTRVQSQRAPQVGRDDPGQLRGDSTLQRERGVRPPGQVGHRLPDVPHRRSSHAVSMGAGPEPHPPSIEGCRPPAALSHAWANKPKDRD